MSRGRQLRGFGRGRGAAVLSLAGLLAVALVVLVGCGGSSEETATTSLLPETTTTEAVFGTTETTLGGITGTETTAPGTTGGTSSLQNIATAIQGFQVLNQLPADFPDISMPDNSTLLEAREGDVDLGTGQPVHIIVAAFESQTAPQDQYDHFTSALQDAGYQLAVNQFTQTPVMAYVVTAVDQQNSITVSGGEDSTQFQGNFPNAQNPFAVIVTPAFMGMLGETTTTSG